MSFWKKLFGMHSSQDEESDGTMSTQEKAMTTLPWDYATSPQNGEAFFESIRACLPNVFAEIAGPNRDPVVTLVDLEDIRWRGLLRLVCERPSALYFSPEKVLGQQPEVEILDGHAFYRPPVVDQQKLRVGLYATERDHLVSAMCGIRDIPPPFIKQVQANAPPKRFTVASFGRTFLSVRLVSADAKIAEHAPFSF